MSETLFFREREAGQLQWLLFDQFGRKKDAGEDGLESFNNLFSAEFDGQSVLVVPGEEVLLTTARVPSRQHRQMIQAVPYAVEEQLAADVEDCFFALGGRNDADDITVAVTEHERIRAWVELLGSLNITVSRMISETSMVHGTGVSAVVDESRVHVKWPDGSGMTLPSSQLALAVSARSGDEPLEVTGNEASLASVALHLNELEAEGWQLNASPFEESGFYLLCCQFASTEINLLQGEFKVETDSSGLMQVWRSVAMLTAAGLFLHLLLLIGQGTLLALKAGSYESQTLALYRSVFPDDRNIRDVRRRWDAHLNRSGSSGKEFIWLFAQASQGLDAAGLTLHKVNFNDARGDLILQVMGPRSETLVQYAQKLSSEGMNAEIGTISQEDNAVRGSIRIRSGRT